MKHIFSLVFAFLFITACSAQQTIYSSNGQIPNGRKCDFLGGMKFSNENGAGYFRILVETPSSPTNTLFSQILNEISISSTIPGDITYGFYVTNSGVYVKANNTFGTTGQVLTSQGANSPAIWAASGGSGDTVTVSAGFGIDTLYAYPNVTVYVDTLEMATTSALSDSLSALSNNNIYNTNGTFPAAATRIAALDTASILNINYANGVTAISATSDTTGNAGSAFIAAPNGTNYLYSDNSYTEIATDAAGLSVLLGGTGALAGQILIGDGSGLMVFDTIPDAPGGGGIYGGDGTVDTTTATIVDYMNFSGPTDTAQFNVNLGDTYSIDAEFKPDSIYLNAANVNGNASIAIGPTGAIFDGTNAVVGSPVFDFRERAEVSRNSELSFPALKLDGTWISGGTATTNVPHFLIQGPLANAFTWATSGTGIGVNADTLFAGNLIDLKVDGSTKFKTDKDGVGVFSNSVHCGGGNYFGWGGATSKMYSPSNGYIRLTNSAGTDFSVLQFGGTTNLFPALKRSSTELQSRLADDSAFAPFQASQFTGNDYRNATSVNNSRIQLTTLTTQVTRNVADANPAFVVTQSHASSTGEIQLWQNSVGTVAYLTRLGKLGIGITPTAWTHIRAGSSAAETAPLKLTSGILLGTPESGAIEFQGSYLYYTDTTNTRRTITGTPPGTFQADVLSWDATNKVYDAVSGNRFGSFFFTGTAATTDASTTEFVCDSTGGTNSLALNFTPNTTDFPSTGLTITKYIYNYADGDLTVTTTGAWFFKTTTAVSSTLTVPTDQAYKLIWKYDATPINARFYAFRIQ